MSGPMLKLKQLLYSDLARQTGLEGRPAKRPSFVGLLRRLPHHRFLPIVLCRVSRAAMLAGVPLLPPLPTYLNILLFRLGVVPRCETVPVLFRPPPSGALVRAMRIRP